MNYKGKLYGKIAGKYFDTGVTSEDYDRLVEGIEKLNKGFEAQHEVNARLIEQNRELVEMLRHVVYEYEQDEQSYRTIREIKELLTKHQKP